MRLLLNYNSIIKDEYQCMHLKEVIAVLSTVIIQLYYALRSQLYYAHMRGVMRVCVCVCAYLFT